MLTPKVLKLQQLQQFSNKNCRTKLFIQNYTNVKAEGNEQIKYEIFVVHIASKKGERNEVWVWYSLKSEEINQSTLCTLFNVIKYKQKFKIRHL